MYIHRYICIYTHSVHTYIYTHTYTCGCLCTRIYFRAAHWWDDKTPEVIRCESLQVWRNYLVHQRTLLFALHRALRDATFISPNFSRSCGWHATPRKRSPTRGRVSKSLGCGHLHLAFPGRNSASVNPIKHRVGGFWGDARKSPMNASEKAPQGDGRRGFRSEAPFPLFVEGLFPPSTMWYRITIWRKGRRGGKAAPHLFMWLDAPRREFMKLWECLTSYDGNLNLPWTSNMSPHSSQNSVMKTSLFSNLCEVSIKGMEFSTCPGLRMTQKGFRLCWARNSLHFSVIACAPLCLAAAFTGVPGETSPFQQTF